MATFEGTDREGDSRGLLGFKVGELFCFLGATAGVDVERVFQVGAVSHECSPGRVIGEGVVVIGYRLDRNAHHVGLGIFSC